jgi:hypothetical protein
MGHDGQDIVDSRDKPGETSNGQAGLLELVRDLQRQVIEKAEAAAMWQARAQLLAEQLALPAPATPSPPAWPLRWRWIAAVCVLALILAALVVRMALGV